MAQYQLLPNLSSDEYEALKADIALRGVQVPVEYDELGNILDGHHRIRACQELGVKDWPRIVRTGMTEDEKAEHVLALNLDRRHLDREQRRELVATLRAQGWSITRIAERMAIGKGTVHRDLSDVPSGTPDIVTGKDGKSYPARRPSIVAKNAVEHKRVNEALAQMGTGELPAKMLDSKRVARIAREYQAEQRAQAITGDAQHGTTQLWLGDFRERGLEIEDHTVDLIFTDPPYPREFLPLWSALSAFAARVLRPSGMLVAYTGALDLPEVITRLTERLTYWWAGAVILHGPHSRVHARNIAQGVKPLLFFVPDGFKPSAWIEDTYRSEGEQKEHHEWQQSVGAAHYYIRQLCPPDGLVVDPFLGGGTTGVAAQQLGRNFIGIEIDKVAFATAEERLGNNGYG